MASLEPRNFSLHDIHQLPGHGMGDFCPLCEQSVTRDRVAELKARLQAKEQEQAAAVTESLKRQFARERDEARQKAKHL